MKLLQFILPLAVGVVAQESQEDNVKGLRSMKKPPQLSKTQTRDKKESLRKMRKARRSSDNGHRFILDVTANKNMKRKKKMTKSFQLKYLLKELCMELYHNTCHPRFHNSPINKNVLKRVKKNSKVISIIWWLLSFSLSMW